jgi:hypothetical protein
MNQDFISIYLYIFTQKKSDQEKHMGIFFLNSRVRLVSTHQHKHILMKAYWVWLAPEPATVGFGNMPSLGHVRSRQH